MASGILATLMPIISVVGIVLVALLLVIILFKFCYKTCPPNKAMVITGPTGSSTVIGKAKDKTTEEYTNAVIIYRVIPGIKMYSNHNPTIQDYASNNCCHV